MATSEQSGGAGMFSDLVGLKEHGKGGDDTEKVSSVDVSSVVREVVKESLVPLIQRVMLKIDALDGKVKQMQLAMDEMEEDGRERDGWLKKGLEEMKEELAGVREGVGERTKDEGDESESETETETGAGGLDIEELQALLNQKVEMEKKKKKKNKGVVYHQQGDEVQHHHVASGSHSSSGGLALGPPPPADRGPPAPPPPAPVSSSYRAPPVNAGHPYGQMGHVPPPPPPGTHDGMHSQTTPYTSTSSGGAYAPQSSVSNGGGTYTAQPRVSSGPYAPYAGYQPSGAPLPPPPAAAPPAAAAAPQPHTSGSAGSVPIEKVIDDIAIMGFSREEVRNVLRELTAQGKSVDMNIVLDRLGAR